MTQGELAETRTHKVLLPGWSGGQNLTTENFRSGDNVEHKIVSFRFMDFKIVGGRKLKGSIKTNTSKNGYGAFVLHFE